MRARRPAARTSEYTDLNPVKQLAQPAQRPAIWWPFGRRSIAAGCVTPPRKARKHGFVGKPCQRRASAPDWPPTCRALSVPIAVAHVACDPITIDVRGGDVDPPPAERTPCED